MTMDLKAKITSMTRPLMVGIAHWSPDSTQVSPQVVHGIAAWPLLVEGDRRRRLPDSVKVYK